MGERKLDIQGSYLSLNSYQYEGMLDPEVTFDYTSFSPAHGYSDTDVDVRVNREMAAKIVHFLTEVFDMDLRDFYK